MPNLNKDALEIWNSLRPMIDKEIERRTMGMVQRRKMKVTTAPSISTGTIGVTEAFGTEMHIPFATNLISATVGDMVWVEFMYGATNAFASMFASANEKDWDVAGGLSVGGNARISGNLDVSGSASMQNTTVNGVLDVTTRRCSATLSSAGWYRVLHYAASSANDASGYKGAILHLDVTRGYTNAANEAHGIDLDLVYGKIAFIGEKSVSNSQLIDKVRYNTNGANGYVDIHYTGANANSVAVYFSVAADVTEQAKFTAGTLAAVADSPSGETVQTIYNFSADKSPGGFGAKTEVTTFPFTATTDGLFFVTLRAVAQGRLLASWPGIFICDGYQSADGYINGTFPVEQGTVLQAPTTLNVYDPMYYWYPLG